MGCVTQLTGQFTKSWGSRGSSEGLCKDDINSVSKMSVPECPINRVQSGGQKAGMVAGDLGAAQLPQARLGLSVALFP